MQIEAGHPYRAPAAGVDSRSEASAGAGGSDGVAPSSAAAPAAAAPPPGPAAAGASPWRPPLPAALGAASSAAVGEAPLSTAAGAALPSPAGGAAALARRWRSPVPPAPEVAPAAGGGVARPRAVDLALLVGMVGAPAAAWAGRQGLGWTASGAAVLAGVAGGRVDGRGAAALALVALALARLPPTPWGDLAAALATAPLLLHWTPGFVAWQPFGAERLRPDAVPYRQVVSPDKHIVGGLTALRLAARAAAAAPLRLAPVAAAGGIAAATVAALMGAGLATGYVRLDPRPPGVRRVALWLADNLLLTCVAEEAAFRGLLQPALAALGGDGAAAAAAAVGGVAVLFGLLHYRGGATYVALSAAAGLGYGAAARQTGFGGGIAAHLLLNAVHFLAFSYPALDRRLAPRRALDGGGAGPPTALPDALLE